MKKKVYRLIIKTQQSRMVELEKVIEQARTIISEIDAEFDKAEGFVKTTGRGDMLRRILLMLKDRDGSISTLQSRLKCYEGHDTGWQEVVTALNEAWPNWSCREGHDGMSGVQMAVQMIRMTRAQADEREDNLDQLQIAMKQRVAELQTLQHGITNRDAEIELLKKNEDNIRADERERIAKFFDGKGEWATYPFVVVKLEDRNNGVLSFYSGEDLRTILKDGDL